MHECCGKHLKIKFPITAGISGVSCCWLQLSHGRPVTSSAGLTVLSSKAGLGPCHWGGGTCHFLLKASSTRAHCFPSWVEFHCHDLDPHQERSRSYSKVRDNPIRQFLKSWYMPSIVVGPGQVQRRPTPQILTVLISQKEKKNELCSSSREKEKIQR